MKIGLIFLSDRSYIRILLHNLMFTDVYQRLNKFCLGNDLSSVVLFCYVKTWCFWRMNSKVKAKLFTLETTCVKNVTVMGEWACFKSCISGSASDLEYPGRLMKLSVLTFSDAGLSILFLMRVIKFVTHVSIPYRDRVLPLKNSDIH